MILKRIKFITGNPTFELNQYLMGLTPNKSGKYDNCEFFFNQDTKEFDYLVIFDSLPEKIYIEGNVVTIFITGEATAIKSYPQEFLEQFDHIITSQPNIKHQSVTLRSPGHTWFSKKTYDELLKMKEIKKEKLISIVVSNKKTTQGHRDRLDFCLKLKEKLGDKVDLFGRGFNDFNDKWEVIAPYKYSIAIENSIEDHWITEKLGDCYTSHTFPFYMGAPNVHEYYDSNSFVLIDIYDFENSLDKILNVLNDSRHYENHLAYLQEAKLNYINKHSMVPMICDFINKELADNSETIENRESLIIHPVKISKIKNKMKKFIKKFI